MFITIVKHKAGLVRNVKFLPFKNLFPCGIYTIKEKNMNNILVLNYSVHILA